MKATSGICKLCGESKALYLSHILPKSFTRRMRDGAPQVIAVEVLAKPKSQKSNGEYVERLLCKDCELLIKQKYEDYGTRLFVARKNIAEYGSHVFFSDFDYQKYFLFIVSILWRASVSKLTTYKAAKPLAELSDLLKFCIANNTLYPIPTNPLRLDHFIKVTVLRIIDHTDHVPQSVIDSLILGLNFKRGQSVEEGLRYYFMVDGFLVSASLLPLNSPYLQGWKASGRLKNRRHFKVPKVSLYDIESLCEVVVAIASTSDPFAKT